MDATAIDPDAIGPTGTIATGTTGGPIGTIAAGTTGGAIIALCGYWPYAGDATNEGDAVYGGESNGCL